MCLTTSLQNSRTFNKLVRVSSSTPLVSFQFSHTPCLDLRPPKDLRGKGLILKISRSNVAQVGNERAKEPPLLQAPLATASLPKGCLSAQGLDGFPCPQGTGGTDAGETDAGRTAAGLLTPPILAFPEGHSVCSGEKHFHISSVYLFSF